MCEYVSKNELKKPKEIINKWILNVQEMIKKENQITFSFLPIGSGKKNLVVRLCNRNDFDLDFQIVIQKIPNTMNWHKDCKKIKDIFRNAFNKNKPNGFTDCEDSTQALTSKNKKERYSYDVVITTYDDNGQFYILRNNKNSNGANNNDYQWELKKDMKNHAENYAKIKGSDMTQYLREIYLNKRHKHKDDQGQNKKKSYQILNEAVNETLEHFCVK